MVNNEEFRKHLARDEGYFDDDTLNWVSRRRYNGSSAPATGPSG